MRNLYYEIAELIGFTSPPALELVNFPAGKIAESWTYNDGRHAIRVDESQIYDAEMTPENILLHEFSHWQCRFFALDGGGWTSDGEYHGASFLAGLLSLLKRAGANDKVLEEMAIFHAKKYKLTKKQKKNALTAAKKFKSVSDAIRDCVEMRKHTLLENLAMYGIPSLILIYAISTCIK